MITKLKWQWQSSTNDLAHVSTNSTVTRTSTPNPFTGRVITGMLTGTGATDHITPLRTSGKGTRGNGDSGF